MTSVETAFKNRHVLHNEVYLKYMFPPTHSEEGIRCLWKAGVVLTFLWRYHSKWWIKASYSPEIGDSIPLYKTWSLILTSSCMDTDTLCNGIAVQHAGRMIWAILYVLAEGVVVIRGNVYAIWSMCITGQGGSQGKGEWVREGGMGITSFTPILFIVQAGAAPWPKGLQEDFPLKSFSCGMQFLCHYHYIWAGKFRWD